jgi:hypothetical protein
MLNLMKKSFESFINGIGIVDVHEHHMPEVLLNRDVNLIQLFRQSYAGWTQARPYALPSESRDRDPMLAETGPTTWEALAPFLENSGSTMFVRNLVGAVTDLYGDGEPVITRKTWRALDSAVQKHHCRPEWCSQVLQRAGIERLITDSHNDRC